MGVVCPACGRTSQDREFCDHCNAELDRAPSQVPPALDSLPGWTLSPEQQASLTQPTAWMLLTEGPTTWRARWLDQANWARVQPYFQARQQYRGKALAPCRLIEAEGGAWILAEGAGDPVLPWTQPPCGDPIQEIRRLLAVLRPLADALEELHQQGLVWLTFSPHAMEFDLADAAREDSRGLPIAWDGILPPESLVRFTDLDLRVYPAGQCPEDVAVTATFAPPEVARCRAGDIDARTDVFHLALFAYYWLAGLLPDGFPGSGLEAFGYRIPPIRTYAPHVPLGVPRLLEKGLAATPGNRFARPKELCDALEEAVDRMIQRQTFAGQLRWDIGPHTRTGRTKEALKRGNEDQVLVRRFANPNRALIAVADGITTCDVGSGALASLITTIVLENALDETCQDEQFPPKIRDVCRYGAQTLLDWALEKGYKDQLAQGLDLMGTTLTVGWIQGRQVQLANLGDSRAYLVDAGGVEQLTVDGDLATGMLREGRPPEEILELGMMARALRECIGGCILTPEGKAAIMADSCIPSQSQWPLVPGDILILCSDGLVEEGVFLEPEILAEMVRAHKDLPAQELAQRLADLADGLQRLPSAMEPEGFGDNISCIVVKIEAAP